MQYIQRTLLDTIKKRWKPGKVIILTGSRRVGKTILIKKLSEDLDEPYLLLNGEDLDVQNNLAKRSIAHYRSLLSNTRYLIIDEAQKIPDVGLVLKLIVDEMPDLHVLVTGSSAFELDNYSGEPLTGRKIGFKLFAFSEKELAPLESPFERITAREQRLVFGNYPEMYQLKSLAEKKEYLVELTEAYLLRDILSMDGIRNSRKIKALLQLVAFQVGSEVSFDELGRQLQMSKNTVEKYLDLLEKVFIVYRLGGFSKNLRKEITKSTKWYFLDNGIRNAVVGDFNLVSNRRDLGQLWENYAISERLKYQSYRKQVVNNYFWRTYDQQEIDWIEQREDQLSAYDMKWQSSKKKIPAAWKNAYPDAAFDIINQDNLDDWLDLI